jgi:O-antigen/teichoic acid export membrane protein
VREVRTLARGGAVQIAGQLTQRGLDFVFYAVLTRVLGLAAFGLYRQIVSALMLAAQIGLGGFNYAAVRFIARARAVGEPGGVRGAARTALGGALVVSAVVVAALLIFAEPIGDVFAGEKTDKASFAQLLRIGVAFVPLFAVMQVYRYCTQAYKTMVPSVIAGNITQPTLLFLFGLGAVATGLEVRGVLGALVIATAGGAATAAWYYRRMLDEQERVARPVANVGEVVRFALPQAGSSLLSFQGLGYGLLIIGALSSNLDAGIFAAALALQGPGTIFLSGVVNIWAPLVTDLYEKGEIQRLESLYQTLTRWVATFSFPVWAALIIEPELFSSIFAPDKAEELAPVVAMLAIGNIFYTGTGPAGYVISMTGHPGFNLVNSIAAVGAYIGLGLWVVPEHGVMGMAVVDASVTTASNLSRVIAARYYVGIQPFGKSFLKPVAATAAGALILIGWRLVTPDTIWVQVVGLVIAGIAYLGTLRLLGMDPEERQVLDSIRSKLFKRKIER